MATKPSLPPGDTPLSGLVGSATYTAADWRPLLPWLIFGQGIQVGKSAVRGNGVYSIARLRHDYWLYLHQGPSAAAKIGFSPPFATVR